ncbi:MAG: hypothetical protein ACO1OF_11165 [Adhaeribacter sp.]
MKANLFKSCFLAAAVSLFYACSPEEQSIKELDKISSSEKAMTTDKLSFDNGDTRDGSGFVATVKSDGGSMISVSAFQRFYSGAPNYSQANPGENATANRANLFNTNNAPIAPSDDIDLSAAAQSGNALIINHNSKANVPDDWAWGGTLNVNFSSLGTVTLTKMIYLDNEEGVVINLYGAANNKLYTVTVPARGAAGNGNKEEINLNNTTNVARMEVIQGRDWLGDYPPVGSGAIDDIEFMREIPEAGCTRTQGYWKNHAPGSKKADPNWGNLATTQFFSSGETYLSIFDVQPKGNAYYILAHQYVAATLNLKSGASMPTSVMTAYNNATNFFENNMPTQTAVSKNQLTQWADVLDKYNNGVTGPGHCD